MKRLLFLMTLICLMGFSIVSAGDSASEDISSVKLSSISVDNRTGFSHLRLRIEARKTGTFEPVLDVKKAAQKSLEYFCIGLIMSEKVFWVNLNPDEQSQIIDPVLGNTDLGRIMLSADLRLKEDICALIDPQTSDIGKEFWRRLCEKAMEEGITDKITTDTKLWIVPGEILVYETDRELSLIKSTLRVNLEPVYFSQKAKLNDRRQRELQDFAADLMEELILPCLNKRVNEAYAYADLREVYNALVLAKWYKQKLNPLNDPLLKVMDFNILQDTETDYSYSPAEVYQDYIRSFREGEYSFAGSNTITGPFYAVASTRHYFSGGVDFRNIRPKRTDREIQNQDENSVIFDCDLFIPQGIRHPLQYAKSQIELSPGNLIQTKDLPLALAKNLPAITPVRFIADNLQNLDYTGRTERIILSKL